MLKFMIILAYILTIYALAFVAWELLGINENIKNEIELRKLIKQINERNEK